MATTFAVPDGRVAMAATLYTGTGNTTQVVSNAVNAVSFQPDFVWVKGRSTAYSHHLTDSVRGVSKDLSSNVTNAENNYSPYGTSAFNSNGFSVNDNATGDYGCNGSGTTFVGWNWKAGGTAVSNTAGTITSTVSANTTAGFSVVTLTTQASGVGTFGHGLGVVPSLVIIKNRLSVADWAVYHGSLANTSYLLLNSNAAYGTNANYWNSTTPNSTVFTLGSAFAGSLSYVAYCWAPVAGYSAFGSYTGNGSADGPFIYTGFRPRWILYKRTDTTASWGVYDTSRDVSNVETLGLYPNLSNAETTFVILDGLSNGFKIRNSDASSNTSGGTYIYAAFAENPLKYANAR